MGYCPLRGVGHSTLLDCYLQLQPVVYDQHVSGQLSVDGIFRFDYHHFGHTLYGAQLYPQWLDDLARAME